MPIKQLWAPWRMDFIKGTHKDLGCIFCVFPKVKPSDKNDKKNLILLRSKEVFVILNKYPYNNGHLMVVPYQHTAEMSDLSVKETSDLWACTQKAIEVLKKTYRPEGFNVGMNIGRAGGAGIKDHLHMHIVPRWTGDLNFMPVLSETKSMPQHLSATYDELKKHFGRTK